MLRTERRCFVEYDCPTAVQEALDLSGASGIWHGGAQLRVDKRHSPTKPRKSPEELAREEERKRDPRYKTELCRNLSSCRHGATRTFAHSIAERDAHLRTEAAPSRVEKELGRRAELDRTSDEDLRAKLLACLEGSRHTGPEGPLHQASVWKCGAPPSEAAGNPGVEDLQARLQARLTKSLDGRRWQ